MLGPGPRVLGEVDPAAGLEDDVVHAVEDRREVGPADGDVDRERPARHREREHPRVRGAEALQHREERRQALVAEHLDDVAERVLGAERHHHLVLHEAAPAVDRLPLVDHVERVEEQAEVLDRAAVAHARLAVPELVERPDASTSSRARSASRGGACARKRGVKRCACAALAPSAGPRTARGRPGRGCRARADGRARCSRSTRRSSGTRRRSPPSSRASRRGSRSASRRR